MARTQQALVQLLRLSETPALRSWMAVLLAEIDRTATELRSSKLALPRLTVGRFRERRQDIDLVRKVVTVAYEPKRSALILDPYGSDGDDGERGDRVTPTLVRQRTLPHGDGVTP
jgi:hypothetical protein